MGNPTPLEMRTGDKSHMDVVGDIFEALFKPTEFWGHCSEKNPLASSCSIQQSPTGKHGVGA